MAACRFRDTVIRNILRAIQRSAMIMTIGIAIGVEGVRTELNSLRRILTEYVS
jgi:hypothetical protein